MDHLLILLIRASILVVYILLVIAMCKLAKLVWISEEFKNHFFTVSLVLSL